MNTNPPPIMDETEQRWRATAAPGHCDDALTALHLDISPLVSCGEQPKDGDGRDDRSVLLVRRGNCDDNDVRELYRADGEIGSLGYINGQPIGARLVWDPRLERDCYFLWVWYIETGHMLWEGCRRAITPTGKYGIHRHGNGCEANHRIIHLVVS